MSCLTVVESDSLAETMSFIFTKGAPESLRDLLAVVPPFYDSTFQYHMMRGKRVLAMATKRMHGLQNPLEQTRDIVEKDLHFLGFMVFECEFKADTKSVIRELRSSEHRIVMLTGDSVYTAADVGRKLGIVAGDNKTILILQLVKSKLDTELDMVWRKLGNYIPTDNEQLDDIGFDLSQIRTLAVENDLCVTGAALSILEKKASNYFGSVLRTIAPSIKIFARVSPSQKELIINALNDLGCVTLMCGDGTNDVGALKAAHVGVSIVNNPEFEQRIEAGESSDHLKKGTKKSKAASSRDRMARAMRELQEQEADPTIVKLGDASIASPFTARRTSIDSVLTVIRQGRCTLVTSIQVYIIQDVHLNEKNIRYSNSTFLGVQSFSSKLSRFCIHDVRSIPDWIKTG